MKDLFPESYMAVGRVFAAILIGLVLAVLIGSAVTWYQCTFVEGVC